jgi:hypothetical protein
LNGWNVLNLQVSHSTVSEFTLEEVGRILKLES